MFLMTFNTNNDGCFAANSEKRLGRTVELAEDILSLSGGGTCQIFDMKKEVMVKEVRI